MKQPKDTKVFHFHNANPKGLRTYDCRYRAVSLATGESWEKTVLVEALLAIKTGKTDGSAEFITTWLQEFGNWIKHPKPTHSDGSYFTGKELCVFLKNERYPVIVRMSHHLTCIKNGKIWDTWDCSNKCVYGYWTFEE